ncbi:unnamed protein product [Heligmosomoides polygyrus]|uniref:Reverse transcriptase domain-containing protein n=1 Tax=Heligmosomoides polygyrus TaxID=6339 RepID=A0A183GDH3_HELPZ|nr:unnamed protein product [Heligmosomoides polygyrus]
MDFVLVKDRYRGFVTDAKIVPYETIAPQHRPLICILKIAPPRQKQVERCGAPRIKWWRMREKEAAVILKIAPPRQKQVERCGAARIKWWRMREKEAAVISHVRLPTVTTVEETWKMATDAIRQAAVGIRHNEAWATKGRQAGMVVDKRREGKGSREVALSRASRRKDR